MRPPGRHGPRRGPFGSLGEYRSAQPEAILMRRRFAMAVASACLVLATAGCGERSQSSQVATRSSAQPEWEAAADPYVVPGWKSGDKASWQDQMTKRAQNQNEYLRMN